MKDENTRIDDLLDINIAKEVERRETARMDASFKERVAAGVKESAASPAAPAPEKPAEEPVRREIVIDKKEPAKQDNSVSAAREITIDEGRTPARKAARPQQQESVIRHPDPADPSVDTVIYDPEPGTDEQLAERASADTNGPRAKRRQRRALLTDNARIIVKDVIIACIIALVISAFIRPTIVQETSMEPTVEPQDYLLMSRQAYRFGHLDYGDIVIFRSDLKLDKDHNKLLIKRVIALPGDTIEIRGGEVYLNGEVLEEPYIAEGGTPGDVEKTTLGDGEVFVMGDHREVSVDSRSFGPIEQDRIVGQAVFRLWPISGFGTLD